MPALGIANWTPGGSFRRGGGSSADPAEFARVYGWAFPQAREDDFATNPGFVIDEGLGGGASVSGSTITLNFKNTVRLIVGETVRLINLSQSNVPAAPSLADVAVVIAGGSGDTWTGTLPSTDWDGATYESFASPGGRAVPDVPRVENLANPSTWGGELPQADIAAQPRMMVVDGLRALIGDGLSWLGNSSMAEADFSAGVTLRTILRRNASTDSNNAHAQRLQGAGTLRIFEYVSSNDSFAGANTGAGSSVVPTGVELDLNQWTLVQTEITPSGSGTTKVRRRVGNGAIVEATGGGDWASTAAFTLWQLMTAGGAASNTLKNCDLALACVDTGLLDDAGIMDYLEATADPLPTGGVLGPWTA